jgi:hypothetical protein
VCVVEVKNGFDDELGINGEGVCVVEVKNSFDDELDINGEGGVRV